MSGGVSAQRSVVRLCHKGARALVAVLAACLLGVLAGAPCALASTSNLQVLGFGENLWGQLGDGTYAQSCPTPTVADLPGLEGTPTEVAVAWDHSIVLTSGGQVYTIGASALGGGNRYDEFWTAKAITLPGATAAPVQVAAGADASFVITASGQLYAFGEDRSGQLGNGSEEEEQVVVPELISLPGIVGKPVQVAAGREFTLVLTSGGQLYTFGSDVEGQLGDGGSTSRATPEAIALPGATGPPVQIAAGAYHSLVLTETGQLYAFGDNDRGQLGNDLQRNERTPQLVTLPGATGLPAQIAAGWEHSLVATTTGQLYTFGNDEAGQLGNGESDNDVHAVPQEVTLPGQEGSITQIAAGREDSLVVTSSGQLYTFGGDQYGQLGNGVAEATPDPTPALAPVGPVAAVALGSSADDSLVMVPAPLEMRTASLPVGTQGVPYSATALAVGGTPPLSWSAEGLPEGLSIDSETGQISGTPEGSGDALVTLTVTDANGVEAHSIAIKLVVFPALEIKTQALPAGTQGLAYTASALASGGDPPLEWSAAGLPVGLSIDSETGQISGTPEGSGDALVTLTVTDANGVEAHSGQLELAIAAASSAPPGETPSKQKGDETSPPTNTENGDEQNPPAGTQTSSTPQSNSNSASTDTSGGPAQPGGGGQAAASPTLGSAAGKLQAVRQGNGRLTLTLDCIGAKGRVCSGRVTLSTRERTRASGGAAFTANMAAVLGAAVMQTNATRTLQLASVSYRLNAGTTVSVRLLLSAAAKRLLARMQTLPAQLVVSGTIAATRNVTLREPAR